MNIPKLINQVQAGLNSKAAVVFDWLLALGTIGYGAYLLYGGNDTTLAWAIVACGLVGCILAYARPSNIANKFLAKTVTKQAR